MLSHAFVGLYLEQITISSDIGRLALVDKVVPYLMPISAQRH